MDRNNYINIIKIDNELPITPTEIIEFMNERFAGKPDTPHIREEIENFRSEWVRNIIYNNRQEEALLNYISIFKVEI